MTEPESTIPAPATGAPSLASEATARGTSPTFDRQNLPEASPGWSLVGLGVTLFGMFFGRIK